MIPMIKTFIINLNGAIGDWDVSSVTYMSQSKCSPAAARLFAFFVLTPAFFFSPDSVLPGGKF